MRTVPLMASCLVAVAMLGGCGLLPKKKPDAPEATLPAWIGRVAMVDQGHRFALVDTGAPMQLAPGAKLLSFRDQCRTASLQATPESRPPYLAVDITEGMPSMGDQVALDESLPPPAPPVE